MYKKLNIYYQNVRGLRTKTNTFLNNLVVNNYDIICLTETWLTDGIFDAELFDSRYTIFRKDRDYARRGDTLGGGVLIAVRNCFLIQSSNIMPIENAAADVISISLSLNKSYKSKLIHIYCVYFPMCRTHSDVLCTFFETLCQQSIKYPHDNFLIIGDFNIPTAQWLPSDHSGICNLTNNLSNNLLLNSLREFISFTAWLQYNNIYNYNNKLLDLLFCSIKCNVSKCIDPLVNEDSHHPALVATVSVPRPLESRSAPRVVRLYGAADYNALNKEFSDIDWHQLLNNNLDVNDSVKIFYDTLESVIIKHVPTKIIKSVNRYPSWYSPALIKIVNEKLKYHKKWKKFGRQCDYQSFKLLRSRQKNIQSECYENYIRKTEANINANSKHFWTFLKSKKALAGIPDNIYHGDVHSSNTKEVCEIFNSYFHSVFQNDSNQPCYSSHHSPNNTISLNNVNIPRFTIEKYLKALDINKGCGPDGVPAILLNNCYLTLSLPLNILFKKSLSSGIFPLLWKQTHIIPIHKSGDKHDVQNYRPISKISIIPKLFEKIIYDNIFPIIKHVLINQQHGFTTKRSTETNLSELTYYIAEAMESNAQVDVVYTDYSKAFDKINHELLLYKLKTIGIHGDLLRWVASYLRERNQAVTIKGYCSSFLPVTSGVPQGSHLGPLLFNIFINDIDSVFKNSSFLLYADDNKIFRSIKSHNDCLLLQEDLNRLIVYCNENKLILNIKKCNVITFSRKNKQINYNYKLDGNIIGRVSEVRDLGVILDSKLSFSAHVSMTTDKAYKMLGFIFRTCTDFKQPSTIITVYNAYVRSLLEYASIVWNPQYSVHINCINKIHNSLIKYIKYKSLNNPIHNAIINPEKRRNFRDQIFLYKIVHNLIDSPYLLNKIYYRCPRIGSRCKELFHIPFCKRNYMINTFPHRACNKYNKLLSSNIDILNTNLNGFRNSVLESIS